MSFQFDVRTPVVAVELTDNPAIKAVQWSPHNLPPPNNIALYVVSDSNPIIIPYPGQRQIILGRDIPEDDSVKVNLKIYHAQLLGVSRQHATIRILDGSCVVEDLNSTNGTWVNESRLAPQQPHPLQSGDLLRLGHLMIFVSFQE